MIENLFFKINGLRIGDLVGFVGSTGFYPTMNVISCSASNLIITEATIYMGVFGTAACDDILDDNAIGTKILIIKLVKYSSGELIYHTLLKKEAYIDY